MIVRWLRRLVLHSIALVGRVFVRHCEGHTPPARILVIKPDHLGDVLLATPALRLLRQRYPDAYIVTLIGPWSRAILANNHDSDVVMTLPFPGFNRGAGPSSLLDPYRMLLRYALLLRAGNFDMALVLRDDHWWGAALALLAGIPCRTGYAVPECRPFLTTALPWNPQQHVSEQGINLVLPHSGKDDDSRTGAQAQRPGKESDMFCDCVSVFRISASDVSPPLVFTPTPAEHAWADDWLMQHGLRRADGQGERFVVIHPGTGGVAKLWLPERWAAVGNALVAGDDVRLVLTGGPGEQELVDAVARLLDQPPLMLVGSASIGQLAALLGRAALVMGVDSGPLHLAVSQQTPTVHLYGPGSSERFGPWGPASRHVVVQCDIACRPCGVFSACPRGTDPPECMAWIGVGDVVGSLPTQTATNRPSCVAHR